MSAFARELGGSLELPVDSSHDPREQVLLPLQPLTVGTPLEPGHVRVASTLTAYHGANPSSRALPRLLASRPDAFFGAVLDALGVAADTLASGLKALPGAVCSPKVLYVSDFLSDDILAEEALVENDEEYLSSARRRRRPRPRCAAPPTLSRGAQLGATLKSLGVSLEVRPLDRPGASEAQAANRARALGALETLSLLCACVVHPSAAASDDTFAAPLVQAVRPTPTGRLQLRLGPWLSLQLFLFKTLAPPKPVSGKTVLVGAPADEAGPAEPAGPAEAEAEAEPAAERPGYTEVKRVTMWQRADGSDEADVPPSEMMAGMRPDADCARARALSRPQPSATAPTWCPWNGPRLRRWRRGCAPRHVTR